MHKKSVLPYKKKGGIAALTHALAVSMAGRVRVNSISLGWIDTDYEVYEGPDATQQPAGRVGNPKDIANMVSKKIKIKPKV